MYPVLLVFNSSICNYCLVILLVLILLCHLHPFLGIALVCDKNECEYGPIVLIDILICAISNYADTTFTAFAVAATKS